MQKKIPIDKYGDYVDYKDGLIYIIEKNSKGNTAQIQVNGVMCSQAIITGFIAFEFKSKSKYFNPNFWYKRTSWTSDDKIYFDDKTKQKFNFLTEWDKILNYADKHSKPVENILKSIKKEVEKNIGKEISFDFNNLIYGKHWYEAYIPIKIKNKKYLLTWQNCD